MFSQLQIFLPGGKTDKKQKQKTSGKYPSRFLLMCAHSRNNVFSPLQGFNQWNNDVVELWTGNNSKQSYSYLIQNNSTNSFTWSFQRTEELSPVS